MLIKGKEWSMEEIQYLHEHSSMKKDFCVALGYADGKHYDRIIKRLGLNSNDFGKYAENFYGKPIKNGDIFDLLTVIDANCDKTEGHGDKKSKCQCECGNIVIVRNADLKRGDSRSCGCLSGHDEQNKIKNGDVFGALTVIDANCTHSKGTTRPWLMSKCQCECGNEVLVRNCSLRSEYRNFSCGCKKSIGEQKIIKILKSLNINYCYQYNLNINSSIRVVLDFVLKDKADNIKYIIEYNGKQHYEIIPFFGGEERFYKQQKRDDALREYCKDKQIKLIEISYRDLRKLDENYIKELLEEKYEEIS